MTGAGVRATRQRAAITLCFYENMGLAEAADVLKTSVGAVESLLHRAKAALRERLQADTRPQDKPRASAFAQRPRRASSSHAKAGTRSAASFNTFMIPIITPSLRVMRFAIAPGFGHHWGKPPLAY